MVLEYLAYGQLADEIQSMLKTGQQPEVQVLAEKYPQLADEMDQLSVLCSRIRLQRVNGSYAYVSAGARWLPLRGGGGGSPFTPFGLPANQVLRGAQVRAAARIDQIRPAFSTIGYTTK